MSEVYLGKQICNVVACEGVDRIERHETLTQWRTRLGSSGFVPVHLGSNAFKQASMLLALFAGGDGYRVEENNGCLMLGWHTRPLIATSAWRLANKQAAVAHWVSESGESCVVAWNAELLMGKKKKKQRPTTLVRLLSLHFWFSLSLHCIPFRFHLPLFRLFFKNLFFFFV